MIKIFILLTSLMAISYGELTCNGIEYSYNGGLSVAIPAGVCYGTTSSYDSQIYEASYKYKCDGSDNLNLNTYSSSDCAGDAVSVSVTTMYSTDYGYELNDVCGAGQCDYVEITQYAAVFTDADDCSMFDSDDKAVYVQTAYIANYCTGTDGYSMEVTCDGSTALINTYSTSDCTGDAYSTEISVGVDECVQIDDLSVQYQLQDVVCSIGGTGPVAPVSNPSDDVTTTEEPTTTEDDATTTEDDATTTEDVNQVMSNNNTNKYRLHTVFYAICIVLCYILSA